MILTRHMTEELRDQLLDAQEHLRDAIAAIEFYVRETDDRHAEAYILDQLKIIAGREHGFLAGDLNLDDILDGLNERDAQGDEEPDDGDENDLGDVMPVWMDGRQVYYSPHIGRYVTIPTDED